MRVFDLLRARLVTGFQPVPISHGPLTTPADNPWDPRLAPAAPAPADDGGLRMRDLAATSTESGGGVRVEIFDFPPGDPGMPALWDAEGRRDTIEQWRWTDAAGMQIEVSGNRLSTSSVATFAAVVGHDGLGDANWVHPFAAASRMAGRYVWPFGAEGAPNAAAVHRLHARDPAGWRVAVVDTGGAAARDSGGVWPQRPGPAGSGDPVPIWAGAPFPSRKFQLATVVTPRTAEPRPWKAPPQFPPGVELEFGPLGSGRPGAVQDRDEQAARDWALTAVTAPAGPTDTGFGLDPFIDRRARVFFQARVREGLAFADDTAEHWLDLISEDLVRMRGAGDDADGAVVLPPRPDLGLPEQVVDVHGCDVVMEPAFLRLDSGGRPIYQLGVELRYSCRRR